jgi:hypothetical protein
MAIRSKLKRLQKAMRGNLAYIELADGSRHWFDSQEVGIEIYLYFSASLRTVYHGKPRPESPAIVRAVAAAKDRRKALAQIPSTHLPLDAEALVERGEFVPRPLVAGRDVDEPVQDLSEP